MAIPMDTKIHCVRIAAEQPFDGTHYMCVEFEEAVADPNDCDFEEFEIFKYFNEMMNHSEFVHMPSSDKAEYIPARQLVGLTLREVQAQYPNLVFCS